jgi:uncharacterized protein
MHEDLEKLVALQKLDTGAEAARRRLADEPERDRALTARLDAARDQLAAAKARLSENQNARRTIEKDVALHQGRLSKFREQAMAVKTNQEYHAIQKEISFAQTEIKGLEDRILEQMLEADDLTGAAKKAEANLASEQKAAETARKEMTAEHADLEASLARMSEERAKVVSGLNPELLAIFEQMARKRNGIAVAEARDGVCTICHVRLRPQVFNTVRRNDQIVQCDSCQRFLYFVAKAVAPQAGAASSTAESGTSNADPPTSTP